MRKLRTKKQAWKYRSSSSWINAVYQKNKSFINEKIPFNTNKSKEKVFKELLVEQIQTITGKEYVDPKSPISLNDQQLRDVFNETSKIDLKKALDKLSRSDTFSSFAERQHTAAYETLHENKEAFKAFRKATGWKQKVDIEKFEWDREERVYKYEGAKGTVYLDLQVSPKATIYTFVPKLIDGKPKYIKGELVTEKKIISEWEIKR